MGAPLFSATRMSFWTLLLVLVGLLAAASLGVSPFKRAMGFGNILQQRLSFGTRLQNLIQAWLGPGFFWSDSIRNRKHACTKKRNAPWSWFMFRIHVVEGRGQMPIVKASAWTKASSTRTRTRATTEKEEEDNNKHNNSNKNKDNNDNYNNNNNQPTNQTNKRTNNEQRPTNQPTNQTNKQTNKQQTTNNEQQPTPNPQPPTTNDQNNNNKEQTKTATPSHLKILLWLHPLVRETKIAAVPLWFDTTPPWTTLVLRCAFRNIKKGSWF